MGVVFYSDIDPSPTQIKEQIKDVFDNPEVVITKYIQAIMEKVIQVSTR